jgi:hypothetical protein
VFHLLNQIKHVTALHHVHISKQKNNKQSDTPHFFPNITDPLEQQAASQPPGVKTSKQ